MGRARYFSFVVFLLGLTLSFVNARTAYAYSGEGAGTPLNPYRITTCAQLQEITNDQAASYKIMNFIDCGGSMFTPIGDTGPGFTGTLDGGGNIVDGITAIELSGDHVGMFRLINGGTVSNLTINNSSAQGQAYVGVLAGGTAGFGIIDHVIITNSNAMGEGYIGGMVGSLFRASVSDSYTSNTTVNGTNVSGITSQIGGLTGEINMSDVSRTYVLGGGVTGNINDPTQAQYTGGFAGDDGNGANIEDSFTTADVSGHHYVGGMSGRVNDSAYVSSYASGDVTGSGSNVGGFAGALYEGVITNSFATGAVSGFTSGGLVGLTDAGSPGQILGSYWDVTRSGTTDCVGDLQISVDCTGVNVSNAAPNYFFNNHSNAPLTSWNFGTQWRTNPTSYPTFQTVPAQPDNVRITASATALQVLWDPPTDNGGNVITSYDLQWGLYGGSLDNTVSGLSVSTLTYTLHNLSPSTTYSIQIRANNTKGNGVWLGLYTSTLAASTTSPSGNASHRPTFTPTSTTADSTSLTATPQTSPSPTLSPPSTTTASADNSEPTSTNRGLDFLWFLIIPGAGALIWLTAVGIGKIRK
jgi:hypothetical protein